MTAHVDASAATIARMKRLNPDNPQLHSDVDILRDELAYRKREHEELRQSLHDFQERLGRLQRGDQPDSDSRGGSR